VAITKNSQIFVYLTGKCVVLSSAPCALPVHYRSVKCMSHTPKIFCKKNMFYFCVVKRKRKTQILLSFSSSDLDSLPLSIYFKVPSNLEFPLQISFPFPFLYSDLLCQLSPIHSAKYRTPIFLS
jgi:hypothetical protein